MKLDANMLRRHGACWPEVEKFKKTFPKGAAVTKKNLAIARAANLDVEWFIYHILATFDRQAHTDYHQLMHENHTRYREQRHELDIAYTTASITNHPDVAHAYLLSERKIVDYYVQAKRDIQDKIILKYWRTLPQKRKEMRERSKNIENYES